MEFLSPDKGLRIAQKWLPRIECEVAAFLDFPCSIDFSGQAWGEPFELSPPLYWWSQEDRELLVCGYCVYHARDISHRHDFTGLVYFYDKTEQQKYFALRSHFDIKVHQVEKSGPVFRIEQGAHPIVLGRSRPGCSRWLPNWQLRETTCISHPDHRDAWQKIRSLFAPAVTLPIDWDDTYLNVYADKYLQRWCQLFGDTKPRETRGMIYRDPKGFLTAVKRLNRLQ